MGAFFTSFLQRGYMDKKKIVSILFFIIVAVGAVLLRLAYVDTALWYDEACSWFTASQKFPMGILDNLFHLDLQHTPLYFFLLHFWMKVFGDGEVALRILSIIFGVAAIPMSYVIARKLMANSLAIISMVVVAFSPLLVFFSAEVRMYPIVAFLVLLSLNFLIDFENKGDRASLVKLVISNLLIPYTLVGGILYNVSLILCYGIYLFKSNREKFIKYLVSVGIEFALLIPYFLIVGYYAKMRGSFVIKHEGALAFFQIVDTIRNFFGSTLIPNIYWPSTDPYILNFAFSVLVIVPCVYFMYGLVQGFKNGTGFLKVLYAIFFANFMLAVIFSAFEVNVFTVRYILYLVAPLFILSIIGLSGKLSGLHLKCFISYFVIASIVFTIQNINPMKFLKVLAFKSVRVEADKLEFGENDVVIMPFGSDAPYYFRAEGSPKVFVYDFHKEARNPYNDTFYNPEQQKLMDKPAKYGVIYDRIFADEIFSTNMYEHFVKNVNHVVPQGRFVLLALYAGDVKSLVSLEDIRKSISSVQDIKADCLGYLLMKYLYDVRAILDRDFVLLNTYTVDNYTYMLMQKK